jgi:hypothetical protein
VQGNINLRDIKPIVEIPDGSFYIFIALVIVGIIVLLALIYLLYRFIKIRKKINIKKQNLAKLKNINLKDSKKASYEITKLAYYFAKQNPEHKPKALELIAKLQDYKYKKTVSSLDDYTISCYHVFVELVSNE